MSWWEILIIIAAAGFVVGVIVWRIIRKKQGKPSCCDCGGNCSVCPACANAQREKEKAEKK